MGFSIFDYVLFLLKFPFLLKKKHRLFYLNHLNSFQNYRTTTQTFASKLLIFKLQQQVATISFKISDIWVNWSSPKTDMETNIFYSENQSLENVSFLFRRNYLSKYFDIPLLINRFIRSWEHQLKEQRCEVSWHQKRLLKNRNR